MKHSSKNRERCPRCDLMRGPTEPEPGCLVCGGKGWVRREPTSTKCRSCGTPWTEHKGIEPTCKLLQVAMEVLRNIATTPRNRGARRYALSVVEFIDSLITFKGRKP